jgi:hypothetical protein
VSLVVLSFLDVLYLVLNTSLGESFRFEPKRGYGPRSSFCGVLSPLVRREWFPRGGSSFGRRDRMDCANPTLEQMAQH